MDNTILQMEGIRKSFGKVEVLHNINFQVERGKVTALVGENGAGKSTLMKIMMGEYQPDAGRIVLDGEEVHFQSPTQGLAHGISMIFQEMSPFPDMTVAQNLYLGREPRKWCFVNNKEQNRMARELLDSMDIRIPTDVLVKELSVAEIQLLEIAKAVSWNSKVVVMDEPTSALTDREVVILFDVIDKLKKAGVGIVYITHKLEEIPKIADNICVLRDGVIISNRSMADYDQQVIISEMVGRPLNQIYPSVEKQIEEPIFHVVNLERDKEFKDISFEVRRGEILGFAGMVGAGRTEIVEALFGITKASGGKILYQGQEVKIASPKDGVRNRFALVPEDRARCGLNLRGSVLSNICLTILDKLSKGGMASKKRELSGSEEVIQRMKVKINSTQQLVSSLSGGNQQKIVVAKWLLTEPDVVFLDEPTRGIDVGAKYEIYQLIQDLAKSGKAVIVISSEMPELLGICDRILVLKDGRIVSEMSAKEATQEKIMEAIVKG